MNIYPFAGEIKMTKVIKDGQEVIEWEQVDMSKHSYGSLGIGTPSQVKWDASAPLTMGKPVERIRFIMSNQEPEAHVFAHPTTEWARVDKDLNVTHLDMELCAKGPQNVYTALALAIWDKAIAHEREACAKACVAVQCEPQEAVTEDGWCDWVCPKPQGYLMQCCDCELIHEVDFRVVRYESEESEVYEVVDDPNLQAQMRLRRRDDLSPQRKWM